MNTITINELAGYLQHDLKIDLKHVGIKTMSLYSNDDTVLIADILEFPQLCKPLLWPLDFLTKEIPFEGKMIVPIDELLKLYNSLNSIEIDELIYYWNETDGFCIWGGCLNQEIGLPFYIYQQVLFYQIDIFNLIPRGLALSKETLAGSK